MAPPPIVRVQTLAPPPVITTAVPPPVIHVTAPVAPPPPPPPRISQAAQAKGNPQSWVTTDDYPASALRENRAGTVGLTWQINEQGRVENCSVTSSSGSPDLDETACKLVTRRGKYTPAKDQNGNFIRQTASLRFTWVIPKE